MTRSWIILVILDRHRVDLMLSATCILGVAFIGLFFNFAVSLYRRRKTNPNRTLATTLFDALLELPMMLKIGPWASNPDIHVGMKLAMKETGLSDFGPKSTFDFVQRYNTAKTVGLIKSKSKYAPFGHYLVLSSLVRRMKTRLQLIDYIKKHPVVLETKLKSPIFVVGFTRTGSTFLHEMLGLNEHAQMHYTWEQYDPIPTTHDESLAAQQQDRDRKYNANKLSFHFLVNVFFGERMQNIHRLEYDAPEECTTPCAIGLPWSPSELPFNLFAIDELIPLGAGDTFHHYRTFLQLLTWQAPERRDQDFTWVLKCPFYLPYLDALHQEFPDATIVWTHRDPAECIASACSLFEALLGMGMDEASLDRAALGRAIMHYTHRCLEVAEKTIARLGEKLQITHVRYSETIKKPKETCKRVYNMAGVAYTSKYDAALDTYLQQSEKHRAALKQRNNNAAVHVYRPEDYGLSAGQIREEFAAYISKYC